MVMTVQSLILCILQRATSLCAPGLVKFVPAAARLFFLALPGSFLTMFEQNKVDFCMQDSEESYRKALSLRPRYADCHFNLGNLRLKTGNVAEAIEEFEVAIKQVRSNVTGDPKYQFSAVSIAIQILL